MSPVIALIDKTINTISGRDLVATSEMVDLLLDLRILCELGELPQEELVTVSE